MNESPAGRDGWIMAYGHRIYHVYKQDFPMEFIYGLTPDANRETSPGLIDIRTLPEKYRRSPVEVSWLEVKKRSFAKRLREQLNAHAMAFAAAIIDGYDLQAHAQREEEAAVRDARDRRAAREAREVAATFQGLCPDCADPTCRDSEFGCIPF